MVAAFAGAWASAESEQWRLVHVTLGYTIAGLVGFRLVWGLIGSRHARFASFVSAPRAVAGYLLGILRGRPQHYTGHNPAGALAIVVLLGLAVLVAASGFAIYSDIGDDFLPDSLADAVAEAHAAAATLMLAIVGVHVAGVLVSSWLHGENLVAAMVSGRKAGRPDEGIRSAWNSVGLLLLAAVLGFWFLQWQSVPVAEPTVVEARATTPARGVD
jgi:cytochrome b